MFETASQTVYTVGYISVLQTLDNNNRIGINVSSPYIDSDVAAAAIKMCNWHLELMICFK